MTANRTLEALFSVDQNWVAQVKEEILEPDLPIIDPHHHLWDRGSRYLLEEIVADLKEGHNVVATVFVQCGSMYRLQGDPDMASLGETEFVNGIAACAASGVYGSAQVGAGIVGFANLLLGDKVDALLELHKMRAGCRFKGVRHSSVWDEDQTIKSTPTDFPPRLLLDAQFRRGFARLSRYDLSFDGWLYHTQIPEFTDLARTFPQTTMILDHIGAPLAVGRFAGRRKEVFEDWKRNMAALARCENVYVKLGGVGIHVMDFGFDFQRSPTPPGSTMLADAWRPYAETVIELFGPGRCMFESNFPVDKRSSSYHVLWNSFKKIASGYSDSEKADLFKNTAARAYRLHEFL